MSAADARPVLVAARKPLVTGSRQRLRDAVAEARGQGKSIGLVPTMGGLHAGHLSLIDASCRECDFTVVTVFVNPTQFGPGEDFQQYPRDLDTDIQAMEPYAVDCVFSPERGDIFRPSHATFVEMGGVAQPWEGVFRPGHFRGVTTVVLKLLNLATPDVAFFGQKDFQQSLIVQRMVDDLDINVRIRVCPIVRDSDGLALSSRNVYLSDDSRQKALVLSRSLRLAEQLVGEGLRETAAIRDRMRQLFRSTAGVDLEYIAVVDPATMEEVDRIAGPTLAAVAAVVGGIRLIDNQIIGVVETLQS